MRVRLDATRSDQLVAAALFIGVELQVALGMRWGAHAAVAAIIGGFVTASVALRRRYPAAVGLAVQAAMASTVDYTHLPAGPVSIGWFCALYALAVWTTLRWFVVGVVFFAGSNIATALSHSSDIKIVGPFTFVGIVVMILLRMIVGAREHRVRIAERERDVAAREAVIDERSRIARELHDAIAHNVSMMVVQAGAERRLLDHDKAATREVLVTIEQMGRGALTEMRRLVGMLRSDPRDPLAPQPGIDAVPTLVEQVRAAGLPVDLRIEGERSELPVGIDLSSYRIVQEGLTNSLKHAGRAHAVVSIQYGTDSLSIEITDDGAGCPSVVPSGGHGLVGLRERASMYGGHLEAGRQPTGGFAIRVRLPLR